MGKSNFEIGTFSVNLTLNFESYPSRFYRQSFVIKSNENIPSADSPECITTLAFPQHMLTKELFLDAIRVVTRTLKLAINDSLSLDYVLSLCMQKVLLTLNE